MTTTPPAPELPRPPGGVRRFLVITVSAGISVVLVVWILASIEEPRKITRAIGEASPALLAAIVPLSLLSHWLRATRWRRFLGVPASLSASFAAVMLGYAVNLVIPRGGEIARIVALHRTEKVRISRLVATVFAERLLDVVMLLLLLGVAVSIDDRVSRQFSNLAGVAPLILALAGLGCLGIAIAVIAERRVVRLVARLTSPLPPRVSRWLTLWAEEAVLGFSFARDPRRAALATLETLGIWLLYFAGFLAGLGAFGLLGDLGADGSTVTFAITSASVLVPSQGAIGVYQALGTEALEGLYGIAYETALACTIVLHALLFLVTGGIGGAVTWLVFSARRRPRIVETPPRSSR